MASTYFKPNVKVLSENALHHFFFTRAEQAVVDENAGELIADRLVQERGGDRRIDAAAQSEHDFLFAHLSPHALAGFLDERAHRPIHRAVADVKDKILQDLLPARRVRDFRMKLQSVKFSLGIFDRGEVGIFRVRRRAKTLRQRRDLVAMTVPDIDLRRRCRRKAASRW